MKIKKVHISFSGGETSAWMTYFLLRVYYKCEWNDDLKLHIGYDPDEMVVVHIIVTFANTGQENEKTLVFVKKCDEYFGFNTIWLEAVTRFKLFGKIVNVVDYLESVLSLNWIGSRLGTKHNVVDFESANRDGKVFESFIARYGIPNSANPSCTRELKLRPMTSYLRSRGWKSKTYWTAIGIRLDEIDRVNEDWKNLKIMYPPIQIRPMKKPNINGFWRLQPFRLELKGYQGNCEACYKKSDPKLWKLAQETPEVFDFPNKMEKKYGNYITPDRKNKMSEDGRFEEGKTYTIRFFRRNRSSEDILEESKDHTKQVVDENQIYESESCEVYSNCGERM